MSIPSYEKFLPEVSLLFTELSTITNPAIAFILNNLRSGDSLKGDLNHDKLTKFFRVCDSFAALDCEDILSKSESDKFFTQVVTEIKEIF